MGFSSSRESTWDSDPTRALATITSLAERMDLHVNKLTDAVNSLSSATSNNLDKDGQDQRIRESRENPDNSDIVEVDEVLTIYEGDRTLYQKHK